jgi:hypothetical protein
VLTENDVVGAVCEFLEARGWKVVLRCDTGQRGIDVVAERGGQRLLIEAKGGTSSKGSTARFGKAFNTAQTSDHVANAVFTAMELSSAEPQAVVAVALPDDRPHQRLLDGVEPTLERLGIGALWVSEDRRVRIWGLPLLEDG